MINRWLALILVFYFFTQVSAGQTTVVTGKGEATLENLTQQQALEVAILRAQRHAIEQACGIELLSSQVVNNFQIMADVIENLTRAIIEPIDTTITFKQDTIPGIPQPILRIIATIRARVHCKKFQASNIQVDAGLTRTVVMDGDTIHLWVKSNRSVYLNIFDVAEDGTVTVIYPSAFLKQQRIPANVKWWFPYPLKAVCPQGKRRSGEWLYLIATRFPFSLVPGGTRFQQEESNEGGILWKSSDVFLQEIVEALMKLPPEERQEVRLYFEVRR